MPILTIALITALLTTTAFADITLVRDGRPQAVIIVPEGLFKHVQKPAELLTSDSSLLKTKALTPELAPLDSHSYLRMALAYADREVE